MSKKKGMFSWLGLGKKQQEEAAPVVEDINENIAAEVEQSKSAAQSSTASEVSYEELIDNNKQLLAEVVAIDDAIIEELPAEPEPEPEPEV